MRSCCKLDQQILSVSVLKDHELVNIKKGKAKSGSLLLGMKPRGQEEAKIWHYVINVVFL